MRHFKIISSVTNDKIFNHLRQTSQQYKSGIHEAYIVIGQYLKRTNEKDFRDKKTGRFYRLRINGRIINHRASAPGEPPARLTGKLEKSITAKTSGFTQLNYSAGGGKVNYAGFLEYGTAKMEPRPYMTKALCDNEGKSVITFYRQIGRRLQCE